tara:strand:- start:8988 stop:11912 length:2925 start_codon:yes stop_codon:yes gene_type:complete
MKPFEISMDFLLKSRENRALLESLLDRMEGAELNLDDIDAQSELRDWNRAEHRNKIGNEARRLQTSQSWRGPTEQRVRESKYDPSEIQYPSLRHIREQKERGQSTEEELRMRGIEDNYARRMKQDLVDEETYHALSDRFTIEEQIANKIARFRHSGAGRELQESLAEQLKDKHISKVTGIEPPEQDVSSIIFNQRRLNPSWPSVDEKALLSAIRGGDLQPFEQMQARRENPLIGDMPLEEFEQRYPTEMAVPQFGASAISPDVHLDWLQELKDEHQRLNPTPSVAVEQPLSTFDKISQEYFEEMNERYPPIEKAALPTLAESGHGWDDITALRWIQAQHEKTFAKPIPLNQNQGNIDWETRRRNEKNTAKGPNDVYFDRTPLPHFQDPRTTGTFVGPATQQGIPTDTLISPQVEATLLALIGEEGKPNFWRTPRQGAQFGSAGEGFQYGGYNPSAFVKIPTSQKFTPIKYDKYQRMLDSPIHNPVTDFGGNFISEIENLKHQFPDVPTEDIWGPPTFETNPLLEGFHPDDYIVASEPMDLSWRMLKAQQTIDAYSRENVEEGFEPGTQNVIISSRPGNEKLSPEVASEKHDNMLRQISELEGFEGIRVMSARGMTQETQGDQEGWGGENSFMLTNVPDKMLPHIHSLAEEYEQDSILHSPEGTAGTQFVDSSGESEGGLEEGGFTEGTPPNYTEFPTGQKYAYGDYVAASEPMPIGDVLVKMPQEARDYATQMHEGQMYGEQPYMTHVEDVASGFDDPHLQRIAYLHDVVEDSGTGIDEIHERFGEDVGHAVDALTRREDEQYFDYINRVKEHPEATQVKLADLHSNLKNNPNESLAGRYEKAIDMLKHDILVKDRVSPEAKRHKLEYDTAYEANPERRKYRADLNRERRKRGMYGSGDHRDISHTEGNKLTVEPEHANRARHFKNLGTLRHVGVAKGSLERKKKINDKQRADLIGIAPPSTSRDVAIEQPHDS